MKNTEQRKKALTGFFVRTFYKGGSIGQNVTTTYEEAIANAQREFDFEVHRISKVDWIEIIEIGSLKHIAHVQKNYRNGEIEVIVK